MNQILSQPNCVVSFDFSNISDKRNQIYSWSAIRPCLCISKNAPKRFNPRSRPNYSASIPKTDLRRKLSKESFSRKSFGCNLDESGGSGKPTTTTSGIDESEWGSNPIIEFEPYQWKSPDERRISFIGSQSRWQIEGCRLKIPFYLHSTST